jgi:hypothetical protein
MYFSTIFIHADKCDTCLVPNGSPAPATSDAAPKDTVAPKDTPAAGMKRVTASTAAK